MVEPRDRRNMALACAFLLVQLLLPSVAVAQETSSEKAPGLSNVSELGLPKPKAAELERALQGQDYLRAETVLLPEIQAAGHSAYAGRLLQFAGGIYFLNHDNLNAAIAWKKAETIAPLPGPLRFSLSMAYVRMGHEDWARTVLQALARDNASDALYPFWLGRIDYDQHAYESAVAHFQDAIRIDPTMARAYDNLGLCLFYRNENALAVQNYEKAIALNLKAGSPSAWPYMNLAEVQQTLGRSSDAEASLREALRLNPSIASAHFQLGSLLENSGHEGAAMDELKEAVRLDANYAEPHVALARIYRKLGDKNRAKAEVDIYLSLRNAAKPARP